MAKKMLIDATHAEETRVVVVDGNKVEEFDFEAQSRKQLSGNIYLAKVMRVEPSLQAAFVDYGGNRHGFLAFNEIHPDYYQIPVADREALLAEEAAYAESLSDEAGEEEKPKRRRRLRSRSSAEKAGTADAVAVSSDEISGMETIDLTGDEDSAAEAGAAQAAPEAGSDPEAHIEAQQGHEAQTEVKADAESSEEAADAASDDTPEAGAPDAEPEVAPEEEAAPDADAPDTIPAGAKDDSIESVAHEDESEDIRPRRKSRPKRYKIQEVVKVRQVMLVQVVKEERGNKGAALTTYLSLAGRYCVLMPNTARGGGISRKITNAADRKKLKEIATSLDVPKGAGLIVRTAGSQRTKSEIKRDYEYLQRLWEQIRELTLKSIAPAPIYEEGNLIKRSIRDLYSREIDEVVVEGEAGYRVAKDFMKMIMPSHAKNVKHYIDPMPLYARYQVESTLGAMFNPVVQLPSGGYIVIGITEALVAIDVNSGRATKEGSIEQTALKTNLEAAEEVARQMRLRDLAGLLVIDFIDMDERKNNTAVEKRLKDKLKTDRARIQVGKISGFGLLEMSRQRLRPGMLEASTQSCPHCHGTGLLRSDDSVALAILRALEEEGVRGRSREVLVKAPVVIANYLMNHKREHIAQIEARYGLSVRIEAVVQMISPDFSLEKFKTATRAVPEVAPSVISSDMAVLAEDEDLAEPEEVSAIEDEDEKPKKKRRRRRRRRKPGEGENSAAAENTSDEDSAEENASEADAEEAQDAEAAGDAEEAPKPRRRRARSRKTVAPAEDGDAAPAVAEETVTEDAQDPAAQNSAAEDAPAAPAEKPKRRRTRSRKTAEAQPEPEAQPEAETPDTAPDVQPEETPKPKRARTRRKPAAKAAPAADAEESPKPADPAPAESAEPAPQMAANGADTAPETPETAPQPTPDPDAPSVEEGLKTAPDPQPANAPDAAPEPAADKPKRRGWWSLGR